MEKWIIGGGKCVSKLAETVLLRVDTSKSAWIELTEFRKENVIENK